MSDGGSALHAVAGVVGASVSGVFLWAPGILDLVVLVGLVRPLRRMRHGEVDEPELEDQLQRRGLLDRFLGGLTRTVTKPWHVYPVGVLFGLGLDTATEVGLLVLAGGAAASDLPFYAILVLAVLCAAGMCLMDTGDGVLMTGAYGWATRQPVRQVYDILTTTSISVAVALVFGTIELVGVLARQVGVEHGPLAVVAAVPLDRAGYVVVGLFAATWVGALAIWRYGHVEEKWSNSSGSLPRR